MLDLSNVTLISVNGINSEDPLKAIIYSSKGINFGSKKLFSSTIPKNLPNDIQFYLIPKITFGQYSDFIIKELYKFISTDYALIIQDDGFVLHPENWKDEFFDYDYVGAPWRNIPHYQGVRVGNGGFSLRSKKFLELSSTLPTNGFFEDHVLCISNRNFFIEQGIKFAPVDVAMKFALEFPIEECEFNLDNCFGFHGNKEIGTYDLKKELLNCE